MSPGPLESVWWIYFIVACVVTVVRVNGLIQLNLICLSVRFTTVHLMNLTSVILMLNEWLTSTTGEWLDVAIVYSVYGCIIDMYVKAVSSVRMFYGQFLLFSNANNSVEARSQRFPIGLRTGPFPHIQVDCSFGRFRVVVLLKDEAPLQSQLSWNSFSSVFVFFLYLALSMFHSSLPRSLASPQHKIDICRKIGIVELCTTCLTISPSFISEMSLKIARLPTTTMFHWWAVLSVAS